MKRVYYTLLVLPLFLVSCATVERDVRISVRDAQSKSPVDNGVLIFDRPNFTSWYFSLDPIRAQKFKIDEDGVAAIDRLKSVVWLMKAEVKGYDRGTSVFSLSEAKELGPEDWRKMSSERNAHPNFPGRQLEYRVEVPK
jgi:hypothetical protein